MFAKERREKIIKMIHINKSVKVSHLIDKFGVSFETIRRDLEGLEKGGHLKRVHGGAVLDEVDSRELTFTVRKTKNESEKKELAKIATRYVTEGQSIAIDVSTTNTEFAKALKSRFKRLTVLTNSMVIAHELSEMNDYTILFAGGILRNQELCSVGDYAEDFVSNFHIDTFFMSVSGISLMKGLTDYGIGEVQLKKKMLEVAQNCVVLADSTKFDVISLVKVCEFNQVTRVVTDSMISENVVERFQQNGIDIVYS